jgi:catechol 2,3-dioxygenase-like lactoylglutathione lyase family enzyme
MRFAEESAVQVDLDHAHLFASDIDETVRWWSEMLGARVVFDLEIAGARNVRLAVGRGFIHLYDQPPRVAGSGSIHHLGIQTDDLETLVALMEAKGFRFRQRMKDFGVMKYVMAAAPDNVLLELFQAADAAPA